MEKRKYQEETISRVLKSKKNQLIVSPTGSGKTYISKRIIQGLKDRVLFVTPRIDLVSQTAKAFDYDCDILWKNFKDTGKHVIVASRQTLQRRDLDLSNCVAIFDEVHIGLPATKALCDKFHFKRVLGLTATPERTSGESFLKVPESEREKKPEKATNTDRYDYGIFDELVEVATIQDLQAEGYLCPLEYSQNKKAIKLARVKTTFDELKYEDIKEVLESDNLQVARFIEKYAGNGPVLIFTPPMNGNAPGLQFWKKQLAEFGFTFEVVQANTPLEERQEIYKKARNGEITGIINCALLTYGFDMPEAKTVVLLRNIKSKSLLIQIVGRILRPFENRTAHVYDVGGSIYNFSTVDTPMLFSKPIEYSVTGKWKFPGEKQEIDPEVLDSIGEENVDEFIKNPVRLLLKLLNEAKEDFEERVYSSLLEVKKRNSELKKENDSLMQKQSHLAQIKDWFRNDAFNWSKHTFSGVLREIGYDAETNCSKEMIQLAYTKARETLPFQVLPEEEQYFGKQFASICRYWLQHFHTQYSNTKQEKVHDSSSLKAMFKTKEPKETFDIWELKPEVSPEVFTGMKLGDIVD